MEKGFTLVELIAIIVILSLASVITFSTISTMNKEALKKEYEEYKETLYIAAESYIDFNEIDVTDTIDIDLNTLLENNYLSNVPINPKTNKQELNAKIRVYRDSVGVLVFDYISE